MTSDKKVVSLTQLRDPVAGHVELDGTTYAVRKLTGGQYERLSAMTADSPAVDAYNLVQEIVPDLPDEVRLALDKDLVAVIMTLASNGIKAVEALFPNGKSPETRSTSPG